MTSPKRPIRVRTGALLLPAAVLLFCSLPCYAGGQQYVLLGPSDNFALDQPRVNVEVASGQTSLGPDMANSFLLDTGSQGIMAVGEAVDELESAGANLYTATYGEVGVGGTAYYGLSAPYTFRFAGSTGEPVIELNNTRFLSDINGNFGGFAGIVGMPGMLNRVTEMNLTAMVGGEMGIDLMGVQFHSQLPAGNGHRYDVPLRLVDFPAAGQQNPGDPLPTYAPLPFADVKTRNGGANLPGSFLVDTGAQVSIISTPTAIRLGMDTNHNGVIDPVGEALGTTEIGGVGEPVTVPIVAMDRLALPTSQGRDLVWTDLEVIVLDIYTGEDEPEPIPGILGCDLLTSGWLVAMLGGGESGYIEQTYFDFRNASSMTGMMSLDLWADLDTVSYETYAGDFNGDGRVDIADYTTWADNYGRSDSALALNSSNGDGLINIADYTTWADSFGKGWLTVPEPGTALLLLAGALALRRRQLGSERATAA